MRRYFCGWYFRCQSDTQTLAIIPSYHKTEHGDFCEIQFITDTNAYQMQFPYASFQNSSGCIRIGDNYFGTDGISLNIQSPELKICGFVRFGPFHKLSYDIMGPFKYFPFLQCRHSVYSMAHTVNGEIRINDATYAFHNAIGYMEGDRGYSFPKNYVWTQCSFPKGSLMLSIADIPFAGFHFTGVIGIVCLNQKEYRLATYLGAKAVQIMADAIIVRQGPYTLSVKPGDLSGHPLHAPVSGAMKRVIYEHPSCEIQYRFSKNGTPLLEWDAKNAAFEYEY